MANELSFNFGRRSVMIEDLRRIANDAFAEGFFQVCVQLNLTADRMALETLRMMAAEGHSDWNNFWADRWCVAAPSTEVAVALASSLAAAE